MKNQFTFRYLNSEPLSDKVAQQRIFFAMNSVFGPGNVLHTIDSKDRLITQLREQQYYVAQNHLIWKGKVSYFTGQVYQVTKSDLVTYLLNAIRHQDLRSLLVAPVFDEQPEYVLMSCDDQWLLSLFHQTARVLKG